MKLKKKSKINFFNKIVNKVKNFYQKKILKNRMRFNFRETIMYMLITFAFGMIIGGIIMYGKGSFSSKTSLSLNEFIATFNEISSSYYQDVDDDKLLEAGISGMISYLGDPYATYMNKEEASSFTEDVDGTYSGIGAEVKYNDNKVTLGRIFDESPASKAGLKEGDILIKVNGESIEGKSLTFVANAVKGEPGTDVVLTIIRDKKEMEFTIKRGTVDSISVISEMIEKENKKIGYIYMSIFAANTYDQFKKELESLEEKKIDSLIIDLRSNQGGYLTTVTNIISLFVKKGEPIYQLKTKDKVEIVYDKTEESRSYPIVLLVNSSSASASEVLTGALKETYNAKIVGTTTYGKGKVQKVTTLSNGSIVKYTYQEWLTPKGNYIDKVGITPDYEIKYVYDEKIDNQKEKAIEILLK